VASVDEDVLSERQHSWQRPAPKTRSGYLARYAAMVQSADTGAVLESPAH